MTNSQEIDFFVYWKLIVKRRLFIGVLVVVVTIGSWVYSLFLPDIYRATSLIVPTSKPQSTSALSALSGLVSAAGFSLSSAASPTVQLILFLESRSLAETIVQRHNLIPVLYPPASGQSEVEKKEALQKILLEDAANALRGLMRFTEDSYVNSITMSADARDPQLAVNLIQWYQEGLLSYIQNNTFTQAKRNRIDVERKLFLNKAEFLEASKIIHEFYDGEKISTAVSKLDVDIYPADIVSFSQRQEDNMNGIISFPLNDELANLENKKKALDEKMRPLIVKDVPHRVYLDYLTTRKNLLKQLQGMLVHQYEVAKIEESKDELAFQVIDAPVLPQTPIKPNRRAIALLSCIGSFFLAIFLVFSWNYIMELKYAKKDPA